MGNLVFRIVKALDDDFKTIYYSAKEWDNDNTFFNGEIENIDENICLFDFFKTLVSCYVDNELIGYGEICRYYEPDNYVTISYIINPKYRKLGYGKKLVEFLINHSMKSYYFTTVKVEILKRNLSSITLIENMDFDFDYFDDEKIVFSKKYKL